MRKTTAVLTLTVILLLAFAITALADGSETLGPPSIPVASGSGIVAAGVGLDIVQPGNIEFEVPVGATVQQVLIYWSGEYRSISDETINVAGNPVTGTLIGGPTLFYYWEGNVYVDTYRADITALGLVAQGANSIAVDGMEFDLANSGAGIMVIYDDGSSSQIDVRDGQDLAFYQFAPPLDTTVPQTFNFAPAAVERMAELNIFAANVEIERPNAIIVDLEGAVTTINDPLGDTDGEEWDTVNLPVTIPAGTSSLTVQVVAEEDGSGRLPASLNWLAAALSVAEQEEEGGGCTPGYWRQPHHMEDWAPTGYAPTDIFDTVFSTAYFGPQYSLLDAILAKGGNLNVVARHGTAALLNASHPGIDYPFTVAEVIAAVQSGDVDELVFYNELGVPGFCD